MATGTAPGGIQAYSSLILMVALFAIMYLMIIRPQKKKEQETAKMRDSIVPGDEIVTIGGFYGKVVRVKNDRVTIQCGADRTRLDVAKWAISEITAKSTSVEAIKADFDAEEPSKPTPKSIKRLGKSDDAADNADKAE